MIVDIPATASLLLDEIKTHHVEFFFKKDEKQISGLVNHSPLTLIAACSLQRDINNNIDGESSAEKEMRKFQELYVGFLDGFGAVLVSPKESKEEEQLAVSLSVRDAVAQCSAIPEKNLPLRDYLKKQLKEKSATVLLNELLPMLDSQGRASAKLFHALILCFFPIHFMSLASSSVSSTAALEDAASHLTASGAAMVFTDNRAPDLGSLPVQNLNAPDTGIQYPDADALEHLILETLVKDEDWKELINTIHDTDGKLFLFNFTPYMSGVSEDPKQRFHRIFANKLDLSVNFIPKGKGTRGGNDNGLSIQHNERGLYVCALAHFILKYYARAQGFVAVHVVSITWALAIASQTIALDYGDASCPDQAQAQDALFIQLLRRIWREMCFMILLLETAAEKEGVSPFERARGNAKEVTNNDLYPQQVPEWSAICENVLLTNASHSIKLVYALNSLAKFAADCGYIRLLDFDLMARKCAVIGTAYEIP